MKALVNTKSNYRNLNGTWVTIKKFLGTIVECQYFCKQREVLVTFDLSLTEIKEIKEISN
jgi:hypothetical protein